MSEPEKAKGTGDPQFDAVYRELIFLRMVADSGGRLVIRFLFLIAVLQLAAVGLLAYLALRAG